MSDILSILYKFYIVPELESDETMATLSALYRELSPAQKEQCELLLEQCACQSFLLGVRAGAGLERELSVDVGGGGGLCAFDKYCRADKRLAGGVLDDSADSRLCPCPECPREEDHQEAEQPCRIWECFLHGRIMVRLLVAWLGMRGGSVAPPGDYPDAKLLRKPL